MSIVGGGFRATVRANRWLPALSAAVIVCQVAGPSIRAAQRPAQSDGALTVLEIKPDFYMIAGAGSNVAVHIGRDGVVVGE